MGIFNRKKAEDEADDLLPASLEAALKGLNIIPRDDERCVLAFPGENTDSWYHSPERTRQRLHAAWPSLNEAQLDRACRAINGLIRSAYRETAQARKKGTWANWKPLRSSFYPEIKDYD